MLLRHLFTRSQRLLRPADYRHVFQNPTKVIRLPIAVVLFRNNEQEVGRLGIVVAKKKVPRAIDRNRIRRYIRETFRLHQASLTGWDVVLIVQSSAKELSNEALLRQLTELWRSKKTC